MKTILFALGLALAFPVAAQAATPCDDCKHLPKLEKELFEQEWLQHEFHEYARGLKSPVTSDRSNTAAAMRAEVTAAFTKWLQSPAGGGSGTGAPALGTDYNDCTLVLFVGKATKPFDEAKYRKTMCKELADYLVEHEKKHVEQCKKNKAAGSPLDSNYYLDYAAWDVEAYGAGIRNLRKSIADLAKKCRWQPSMNATKKNPEDGKDQDTVPTMAEAKELAKRTVAK